MCQTRTLASLFDHLVGAGEQREWDGQTKGLGRFQVEDEFDFDRLLNRQLGGLLALGDPADIGTRQAVWFGKTAPIAHQSARCREWPILIDRRYGMTHGQFR